MLQIGRQLGAVNVGTCPFDQQAGALGRGDHRQQPAFTIHHPAIIHDLAQRNDRRLLGEACVTTRRQRPAPSIRSRGRSPGRSSGSHNRCAWVDPATRESSNAPRLRRRRLRPHGGPRVLSSCRAARRLAQPRGVVMLDSICMCESIRPGARNRPSRSRSLWRRSSWEGWSSSTYTKRPSRTPTHPSQHAQAKDVDNSNVMQ